MSEIVQIRTLGDHMRWADTKVLAALREAPDAEDAWREFAHILGAQAVWLGRLQQREPLAAVWPSLPASAVEPLMIEVQQGYVELLEKLDDTTLGDSVSYVNSAGNSFTSGVRDILLHVALHGQYHRGKVNLMLREAGAEPAPVDFIAFVRGAPAARGPGG